MTDNTGQAEQRRDVHLAIYDGHDPYAWYCSQNFGVTESWASCPICKGCRA